jgi:hypothetical protein
MCAAAMTRIAAIRMRCMMCLSMVGLKNGGSIQQDPPYASVVSAE